MINDNKQFEKPNHIINFRDFFYKSKFTLDRDSIQFYNYDEDIVNLFYSAFLANIKLFEIEDKLVIPVSWFSKVLFNYYGSDANFKTLEYINRLRKQFVRVDDEEGEGSYVSNFINAVSYTDENNELFLGITSAPFLLQFLTCEEIDYYMNFVKGSKLND